MLHETDFRGLHGIVAERAAGFVDPDLLDIQSIELSFIDSRLC